MTHSLLKLQRLFKIIIRSVQRNGNSSTDSRSNSFYREKFIVFSKSLNKFYIFILTILPLGILRKQSDAQRFICQNFSITMMGGGNVNVS